MLTALVLIISGFLLGAVPFSLLVGKLGPGVDIRDYGDGNPGAFNVLRAAGLGWFIVAMLLDISKGAFTVGLAAWVIGLDALNLTLISIAPVLGHAFSPFLRLRGGKAVAVTGGVLIGLSLIELPLVYMVMLVFWYTALTSSGWAVVFTLGSVILYMILTAQSTTYFVVLALIGLIFIVKHRAELIYAPRLKMSPLLRPFFKSLELPHHDPADPVYRSGADRH